MSTLSTLATEKGTYIVSVSFTDEDGNSVIPTAITWSLYDSTKNIFNSRSSVAVAVPAASINIVLSGLDLEVIEKDTRRIVLVEYTYNSSYGTGLPGKVETDFYITNLESFDSTSETTLAVTVGTNSWCTLAEADEYNLYIYGRTTWETLSKDDRIRLLVTSYRWIKNDARFSIAASSTSQSVKDAQVELAWYVYTYGDSHNDNDAVQAQNVIDFKVSQFEQEYRENGTIKFPKIVEDLLSDSLLNAGGYFGTVSRTLDT